MHNTRRSVVAGLTLLLAGAAIPALSQSADTAAIDGVWEGPWYRGMSSGKARFDIRDGGGSMELTNAESFGDGAHPLEKVAFDGKTFSFQAPGGGGPMSANLHLNERGDQMKGMGKHEGFGVRFELRRAQP